MDQNFQREQFEQWAGSKLTSEEKLRYFARRPDGGYWIETARAAWSAWEARGIILAAGSGSIENPRNRVLYTAGMAQAICQAAGTEPADCVMMLLTAAVYIGILCAEKRPRELAPRFRDTLEFAILAADGFFPAETKPNAEKN